MKKHLFFILFLMALVLNTIPAVANDYLTIHFKDGHTERHFLKLVESISTSKYDMEGKLHDDYQTQRLVISGETYSYPLLDIDSISYHKVDEEQVKQNVDNIYSTTAPIFEQCSTIEEMEGHIDEIKKMEGVEDVKRSGRDIIVKVRDWYDIVFMYPVEPGQQNRASVRGLESSIKTITQQLQNTKNDGTQLRVAIAHQMGNDPRFEDQRNYLKKLKDNILAMGLDVDYIPSEEGGNLDLDFYRRRMFDYDIVILHTHGAYGEDSQVHFFYTDVDAGITGIEYKICTWLNEYFDVPDLKDAMYIDLEDIYIGTCRTGYLSTGAFIAVTENYIAKSKSKFAEGPHIVFNAACSSLQGDDVLTRTHGNKKTYVGSDAVARIFHEKGADIYLGYNNICTESGYAAYNYVTALLSGRSHESALNNIFSYQHDEESFYKASLIDVINPDKTLFDFIVKTHTIEKTKDDIINEYTLDGKIEVSGTTLSLNPVLIQPGFEISTNSDFSDSKKIFVDLYEQQENKGNGNILFKTNLTDLKSGKTYYYRAFTYDDIIPNFGETYSFTLPAVVEPIDLGLPSGTLWASCNVGAVSPEDYGGYYAWAETEEKSSYSWSNYKYSDAKGKNISKYCISSYHGTVDNLTTIEPEDDAARVNMGKDWRIPTKAEMDELLKKCEWKYETLDGVSGNRVTGPNGNSIFLPDGGAKSGDEMTRQGYGYYWVSTIYWGSSSYCINTVFKEDNMFDRCMGLTIRPVLDKSR